MIRPKCFNRHIDGWERPTPAEIAEHLHSEGVTAYRAAQLVGVDRKTAYRWLEGTPIKYGDWRTLIWECGQER